MKLYRSRRVAKDMVLHLALLLSVLNGPSAVPFHQVITGHRAFSSAYQIAEISGPAGQWARVKGISSDGILFGEGQRTTKRAPVIVASKQRFRALSYFDRDNGYTNRQMIDLFALAYLAANPRLIPDFYRNEASEVRSNAPKPNGILRLPDIVAGSPFLFQTGRFTPLTGVFAETAISPDSATDLMAQGDRFSLGRVNAVNRGGWAVGQGARYPEDVTPHAMLWVRNDRFRPIDLGKRFDQGRASAALSCNDSGWIVGEIEVARGIRHAFCWQGEIWDKPQKMAGKDLGTLGGAQSRAIGINSRNQIVGWSENARFEVRACLWFDSKATELETPDNARATYATAINDLGHIVGYAEFEDASIRPVLWNSQGRSALLSTPTGNGMVNAVNNRAQMVGTAIQTDKSGVVTQRAVLWERGRVVDLCSAIPASSGWQLAEATGINDRGEIVGWGWRNGTIRAFHLTPTDQPHQ